VEYIKKTAIFGGFFNMLPLVNMFRNKEIEFEFSFQNIQTVLSAFGLTKLIVNAV
jgi:hypothetical protein